MWYWFIVSVVGFGAIGNIVECFLSEENTSFLKGFRWVNYRLFLEELPLQSRISIVTSQVDWASFQCIVWCHCSGFWSDWGYSCVLPKRREHVLFKRLSALNCGFFQEAFPLLFAIPIGCSQVGCPSFRCIVCGSFPGPCGESIWFPSDIVCYCCIQSELFGLPGGGQVFLTLFASKAAQRHLRCCGRTTSSACLMY